MLTGKRSEKMECAQAAGDAHGERSGFEQIRGGDREPRPSSWPMKTHLRVAKSRAHKDDAVVQVGQRTGAGSDSQAVDGEALDRALCPALQRQHVHGTTHVTYREGEESGEGEESNELRCGRSCGQNRSAEAGQKREPREQGATHRAGSGTRRDRPGSSCRRRFSAAARSCCRSCRSTRQCPRREQARPGAFRALDGLVSGVGGHEGPPEGRGRPGSVTLPTCSQNLCLGRDFCRRPRLLELLRLDLK